MIKSLHLVRHGEAAQGDATDPGLSSHGVQQAGAIAERLRDVDAELILHSPKRRAAETAAIVSERLGIVASPSALVDDRTPYPTDRTAVPIRYHAFLDRVPPDERDIDAHDLDTAVDTLSDLDAAPSRVIVITHNFVIGWFVRRTLDAPAWRWLGLDQDNAGLTSIRCTADDTRLITFNDTGHLRHLATG